ncbi:LA_2272 family surface repeat-containing protein [Bacteroides sp.]
MKKRKLFLPLALLLTASGILPAQNKSAGINLAIWKGVGTQPIDSAQTTYFNLGILSAMNRQNGVGFNILGSTVQQNMNGMQVSGLANMVGGSMRGLQFSGITNINGNNMVGLSATGLVNISGNQSKGVLLSGMTNISGDNTSGVMASGIMNISGDRASGVQLAGLANLTGSTFNGIMAGGLLNVVGEHLNGVQLTGLANIVGSRMNGVQIGLCNYATKAKGLQIGLVNFYKDEMKGFQLGLVNANPDTRVQMMIFGGNATKINVGARFKNKLFYTIVGAGTHYLDFSDKFSASVFYRGGIWLPLCKDLTISGDLGYQHIETFKNKDYGIPARLYGLQARLNLEYQITKKFGVFATGGYGGSRYYNKDITYDKGVIAEAGIVLF